MGRDVWLIQFNGMRWEVFSVTMRNDLVMIDAYDVSVGCIAEIPAMHMHNFGIQCNAKHNKNSIQDYLFVHGIHHMLILVTPSVSDLG